MPNDEAKMIESLTKDAENGDSISDILNQIPFQERLDIARKMDALNAEHRKNDPTLPDLILTTENDTGGGEHLTDIKARTYGSFYNSNKDVYDLPKAAQTEALDFILDSRLERDSQDSKHLRPVNKETFYIRGGEK
jgi:hypothetical protein